jgi:hypothetical protein
MISLARSFVRTPSIQHSKSSSDGADVALLGLAVLELFLLKHLPTFPRYLMRAGNNVARIVIFGSTLRQFAIGRT